MTLDNRQCHATTAPATSRKAPETQSSKRFRPAGRLAAIEPWLIIFPRPVAPALSWHSNERGTDNEDRPLSGKLNVTCVELDWDPNARPGRCCVARLSRAGANDGRVRQRSRSVGDLLIFCLLPAGHRISNFSYSYSSLSGRFIQARRFSGNAVFRTRHAQRWSGFSLWLHSDPWHP